MTDVTVYQIYGDSVFAWHVIEFNPYGVIVHIHYGGNKYNEAYFEKVKSHILKLVDNAIWRIIDLQPTTPEIKQKTKVDIVVEHCKEFGAYPDFSEYGARPKRRQAVINFIRTVCGELVSVEEVNQMVPIIMERLEQ